MTPTRAELSAPPPAGVECDCEPGSHWHQRSMAVSCDACETADEILDNVFCYTRADAFDAIARIAREAGWTVTETGYYRCPECSEKMRRLMAVGDKPGNHCAARRIIDKLTRGRNR